MRTVVHALFACCLLWLWLPAYGETVILWKAPAALTDFRLTSRDTPKERIFLMKDFQRFAREVVGRHFPDDLTVVIIVQDINMAGGFDIFDDTMGDVRVMDGMGGAALKMVYEISDPSGQVLLSGSFDRFHKRMTPDSFFITREHFPYIRELFKEWAKATRRELTKALN